MPKRRARFANTGTLALAPKAFGIEFEVGERVAEKPFEMVGSVAVVDIRGPMVEHHDWLWDSYEDIRERAHAAFDSAAQAVCLKINSPGGDAAGCFELSRELRALSLSSGKLLAAYVDGMCASAAYAIASAAEFIAGTSTALVGSVGVWEAILDVTAMDSAMGQRYTFVSSGERKLDGNPHVPTSKAAVASLQEKVDLLAGMFFALVEEMRGIPAASVAGLEGAIFLGPQALERGLISDLAVWSELLEQLENPLGETRMGAQAKAKVGYEEARAALLEIADGEDGPEKDKAKRMLAALMEPDGDEKEPGQEGGKAEEEEAKAKAAKAEEEEAKGKKAKAEEEEARAKAAASLDLAKEVQTLKAQAAERDARDAAKALADERAALFAKRPDFSEAVRKTLASVPLAVLKEAVEKWPRVSASATSSANAMTAGGGGERTEVHEPLTEEQQRILDKVHGSTTGARAAVVRGNETELGIYDPAAIKARLAVLRSLTEVDAAALLRAAGEGKGV